MSALCLKRLVQADGRPSRRKVYLRQVRSFGKTWGQRFQVYLPEVLEPEGAQFPPMRVVVLFRQFYFGQLAAIFSLNASMWVYHVRQERSGETPASGLVWREETF
jgi:hypothetical protein